MKRVGVLLLAFASCSKCTSAEAADALSASPAAEEHLRPEPTAPQLCTEGEGCEEKRFIVRLKSDVLSARHTETGEDLVLSTLSSPDEMELGGASYVSATTAELEKLQSQGLVEGFEEDAILSLDPMEMEGMDEMLEEAEEEEGEVEEGEEGEGRRRLSSVQEQKTKNVNAGGMRIPQLDGLDRIDHRSELTDTYRWNTDAQGEGVHVYVIDTGVRTTHIEFEGRIGAGRNFLLGGDPSDIEDCQGHGTHVAATVAGKNVGVAKKATIHPIRALRCSGTVNASRVLLALRWLKKKENRQDPAVVIASLGARVKIPLIDEAVNELSESGVAVVVAAGNDWGRDACLTSPASADKAITVGSIDPKTDKISPFSSKGPCVDIYATGQRVWSARNQTDRSYTQLHGTSMAAPHVAGVIARFQQGLPSNRIGDVWTAVEKQATEGGKRRRLQGSSSDNIKILYANAQATGKSLLSGETHEDEVSRQFRAPWVLVIVVVGSALVIGGVLLLCWFCCCRGRCFRKW
uniref:subtilisin n=1 Tax=Chromera velia CCMP2878 TaxID=1169474 RepID=A0A0G4G9A2_9ALVE|eukprot:Cvel_20845.t1-p1 / transcript=Cvel_20845.t1 / gene=Cvel_20845 / organism=Chromera_velia_CCMP2878 / gene_product=Extracellular serine proteinase, putative / transcript_product=Extracellular serine proteinase, putative / location=Cvel_scaffold1909:11142-13129(+) / protein_length=518 / sequence_SO=supercontig / SO=protein_coding / is_pseudo=false